MINWAAFALPIQQKRANPCFLAWRRPDFSGTGAMASNAIRVTALRRNSLVRKLSPGSQPTELNWLQ